MQALAQAAVNHTYKVYNVGGLQPPSSFEGLDWHDLVVT